MNPAYQPALEYINAYWPRIVRHNPDDQGTLIGLPRPYLVPSDGPMFNEMYYWDSYFIALGVVGTNLESIVVDIVDNMAYLLDRFGFVPNGSRFYFTSRSQPPFFTQLVWLALEVKKRRGDADCDAWLQTMMARGEREHEVVWLGAAQPHHRVIYDGLSRYFDINYLDILASCESGWDHSTRCDERWLEHLPVDLNSILYVRELDFARAADMLGDPAKAQSWRDRAEARAEKIRALMWDEAAGFFFDYDVTAKACNPHASLAGFFPLWAGLATPDQAQRAVETWLPQFLKPGGLVTTLRAQEGRQWAWPNGWSPLQWIVDAGLERYGFAAESRDVRVRWLENNARVFERTGLMWEKYNVVDPDAHGEGGVYGHVTGFGWTNAVFADFARRTP
jgi:alpha,alpha-trehalase